MWRHLALLAVSLVFMGGCGKSAQLPLDQMAPTEKGASKSPAGNDRSAKTADSSDGVKQERLIESLPQDEQYLIVTGKILGQTSEMLDGRLIRIDAILVWLSPGVEAGMSTFDSRDGHFGFEVSWAEVNSQVDTEKILMAKERIQKEPLEAMFRLYGRWEHEDGLFHKSRVLEIDKWKVVD